MSQRRHHHFKDRQDPGHLQRPHPGGQGGSIRLLNWPCPIASGQPLQDIVVDVEQLRRRKVDERGKWKSVLRV